MVPISVFVCLAVLTIGNIYFYERYCECILIIPFMKPRTMYYDNAHLHIQLENSRNGGAQLNLYEKMPKWWKNPYTRFKICCFESIIFSLSFFYVKNYKDIPRILEFLKKKAQSVTYDS